MRRRLLPILLSALGLSVLTGILHAQQKPAPDLSKILAEIKAKDTGQLAVSEEDGRFLRLLVASTGRKHALEIGGASGYSAIWMGQGLR
ncbi:MAG TPA: hypothetical protein VFK20_08285, partial [Vicinamibacterales bacterium]|nr:hypothetical protein [Vicinamibacterales bacterium]